MALGRAPRRGGAGAALARAALVRNRAAGPWPPALDAVGKPSALASAAVR